MSDGSEVRQRGVDSSGRAILASDFMWSWWEGVCAELGFTPVITQGAWMARVPDGGAENSKGYHDGGGCLDLRVWNLTPEARAKVVRVGRRRGAGVWRRYVSQGMDEDHIHLVLGSDHGLTDAAAAQWREYVAGGDGLMGNAPDYEWRPDPIVTEPPEDDMKSEDWTRLQNMLDAQRKSIVADLLAAAVTKAGDSVKKALRLAAGLGRGADE